jgi:hypothetical protein
MLSGQPAQRRTPIRSFPLSFHFKTPHVQFSAFKIVSNTQVLENKYRSMCDLSRPKFNIFRYISTSTSPFTKLFVKDLHFSSIFFFLTHLMWHRGPSFFRYFDAHILVEN